MVRFGALTRGGGVHKVEMDYFEIDVFLDCIRDKGA